MPFLGMDMGAGHSELSNRFHYLAACFWSFYVTYPHIVAVVKSQADYDFARLVGWLYPRHCLPWKLPSVWELQHTFIKRKQSCYWILVRNRSGLPFFEVILLQSLPKSASLPVATVQQAKMKISSGEWNFDYVFFTESDQVLVYAYGIGLSYLQVES